MQNRDARGRYLKGHWLAGPGRPPTYGEVEREEICRRLVAGETLADICRDEHLPNTDTVQSWIVNDLDFAERYRVARVAQAHGYADSLIPLSRRGRGGDMAAVQQARLECDTLKWWLARVLPAAFGDRLELDQRSDIRVRVYLPRKDGDGDPRYPANAKLIEALDEFDEPSG